MRQYEADFAKWSKAIAQRMGLAIRASLNEVVRETRRALSKTGPNASLQGAFGINKKSGPHSKAKGISAIANLQVIKMKTVEIHWGGTFTDKAGAKHDRIYWYGEPLHKWVQASPVGEPPHRQTGDLQKHIQKEENISPMGQVMSGRVGPLDELVYARRQELGGPGRYPARPYLLPTFNKLKGKIEARLKAAVKGNWK